MPACCPRNRAMHSALPQVRPEPSRRLPHGQDGSRRASHAAYASSSAVPPLPGTETTGRMRPPGRASHSRGLSAAGLPGMGPIVQSSLLRNLPDPFPRGAGERLHDRRPGSPANHAGQSSQPAIVPRYRPNLVGRLGSTAISCRGPPLSALMVVHAPAGRLQPQFWLPIPFGAQALGQVSRRAARRRRSSSMKATSSVPPIVPRMRA